MIPSLNIDHAIPALKLEDSIAEALDIMDEHKIFHLPVVEEDKYLGYISEELLLNSLGETVNDIVIAGEKQFTSDLESLYSSIKKLSEANISTLAVLGDENQYLGMLTIHSVFQSLGEISSVRSTGGVFSLIVSQVDYSLVEISRILENNGYKVLSVELLTVPDSPMKIEVVIKLNSNDLSTAFAALERFGYHIHLKYGRNIQALDNKERIDQLFKYLDF